VFTIKLQASSEASREAIHELRDVLDKLETVTDLEQNSIVGAQLPPQ
jgi:hypothetical protein